MDIHILTLFPGVFPPVLETSILGIAREKGLVRYRLWDIRDYTRQRHRKVDDRPYGGGPGMVLAPEPVFRTVGALDRETGRHGRRVMLTPQGRPFSQAMARGLAAEETLVLLCGHYEGFDERIRKGLGFEEISVGDFVTSGGETPALVVVDAVVRLVPGVLGDGSSVDEESFASGLLEYPHYTRPRTFRGMRVPPVLLSGDHARIAAWRQRQARRRTRERRPDLLAGAVKAKRGDGGKP
ncbi:MAG: tRNA (guanosine(37)-N1)-methyltransferase TrmD [Planctomycetota bacterium]